MAQPKMIKISNMLQETLPNIEILFTQLIIARINRTLIVTSSSRKVVRSREFIRFRERLIQSIKKPWKALKILTLNQISNPIF